MRASVLAAKNALTNARSDCVRASSPRRTRRSFPRRRGRSGNRPSPVRRTRLVFRGSAGAATRQRRIRPCIRPQNPARRASTDAPGSWFVPPPPAHATASKLPHNQRDLQRGRDSVVRSRRRGARASSMLTGANECGLGRRRAQSVPRRSGPLRGLCRHRLAQGAARASLPASARAPQRVPQKQIRPVHPDTHELDLRPSELRAERQVPDPEIPRLPEQPRRHGEK
jgi:hypothetical protein